MTSNEKTFTPGEKINGHFLPGVGDLIGTDRGNPKRRTSLHEVLEVSEYRTYVYDQQGGLRMSRLVKARDLHMPDIETWRSVSVLEGEDWCVFESEGEAERLPTLLDVADAIAATPEAYDQKVWGDTRSDNDHTAGTMGLEGNCPVLYDDQGNVLKRGAECGTAFCICGWLVTLSGRAKMKVSRWNEVSWEGPSGMGIPSSSIEGMGMDILTEGGSVLNRTEMRALFQGTWAPPEGLSVPAALRLIHHGMLVPHAQYIDAIEDTSGTIYHPPKPRQT